MDEHGRPAPFCLVGLHSCGDLTPSALQLFRHIDQVKAMVLVACCYHLMSPCEPPPSCPAAHAQTAGNYPQSRAAGTSLPRHLSPYAC